MLLFFLMLNNKFPLLKPGRCGLGGSGGLLDSGKQREQWRGGGWPFLKEATCLKKLDVIKYCSVVSLRDKSLSRRDKDTKRNRHADYAAPQPSLWAIVFKCVWFQRVESNCCARQKCVCAHASCDNVDEQLISALNAAFVLRRFSRSQRSRLRHRLSRTLLS